MPKSIGVCSCSCISKYTATDLLLCAPCPPTFIPYDEFRDHALSRNLSIESVCVISKRCNIDGINENDCPQDTVSSIAVLSTVVVFICVVILILLSIVIIYVWKSRRLQELQTTENFNIEFRETFNNDNSKEISQECLTNLNEEDDISDREPSEEIYFLADEGVHTDSPDIHKHLIVFNEPSQGDTESNNPHSSADIFEEALDDPPEYKSIPFIDNGDVNSY